MPSDRASSLPVVLRSGRTLSRVGYGAMQLERLRADPPAAVALVRAAVAGGADHVDTALFYGDGFVNSVLQESLRAEQHVLIATKIGATTSTEGPHRLRAAQRPAELRRQVEDNLRSLGCDRLDLVYLRRLDMGPGIRADAEQLVPIEDQLAELLALREEGALDGIGLSGVTLQSFVAALPADVAAVQNVYNLLDRAAEPLFRLAVANGAAWVPFFPLGGAFPGVPKVVDDPAVREVALQLGATPAQVGLAWLLQRDPAIALIPGTTSIEHLDENRAAAELVLPDDAVAALDAIG